MLIISVIENTRLGTDKSASKFMNCVIKVDYMSIMKRRSNMNRLPAEIF
jgi:hypothetical protein